MEEIGIFDHQPQTQEKETPSRPTTSSTLATEAEEDLYIKFKKLQRQIDFLQVKKTISLIFINFVRFKRII